MLNLRLFFQRFQMKEFSCRCLANHDSQLDHTPNSPMPCPNLQLAGRVGQWITPSKAFSAVIGQRAPACPHVVDQSATAPCHCPRVQLSIKRGAGQHQIESQATRRDSIFDNMPSQEQITSLMTSLDESNTGKVQADAFMSKLSSIGVTEEAVSAFVTEHKNAEGQLEKESLTKFLADL